MHTCRFIAGLFLIAVCSAQTKPADTASTLIVELGSEKFAVREAAVEKLRELGPEALPAIREAANSTDAGVAAAAQGLVDDFALLEDLKIKTKVPAKIFKALRAFKANETERGTNQQRAVTEMMKMGAEAWPYLAMVGRCDKFKAYRSDIRAAFSLDGLTLKDLEERYGKEKVEPFLAAHGATNDGPGQLFEYWKKHGGMEAGMATLEARRGPWAVLTQTADEMLVRLYRLDNKQAQAVAAARRLDDVSWLRALLIEQRDYAGVLATIPADTDKPRERALRIVATAFARDGVLTPEEFKALRAIPDIEAERMAMWLALLGDPEGAMELLPKADAITAAVGLGRISRALELMKDEKLDAANEQTLGQLAIALSSCGEAEKSREMLERLRVVALRKGQMGFYADVAYRVGETDLAVGVVMDRLGGNALTDDDIGNIAHLVGNNAGGSGVAGFWLRELRRQLPQESIPLVVKKAFLLVRGQVPHKEVQAFGDAAFTRVLAEADKQDANVKEVEADLQHVLAMYEAAGATPLAAPWVKPLRAKGNLDGAVAEAVEFTQFASLAVAGKWKEALPIFMQEGVERKSMPVWMHMAHALTLRKLEKAGVAEAIKKADAAAAAGGAVDEWKLLTLCRFGFTAEVQTLLKNHGDLKAFPVYTLIYERLGNSLAAHGEVAEAGRYMKMFALSFVLDENSFNVDWGEYINKFLFNHGEWAAEAIRDGKPDQAAKHLKFMAAHSGRGIGNIDTVMEMLRKGGAEKQADEVSRAIEENLRTHIEMYPRDARALNELAWLLAVSRRELEDADKFVRRALVLKPDDAAYIDTLAEVYFLRQDRKKAVELSRQALEKAYDKSFFRDRLTRFESHEFPKIP